MPLSALAEIILQPVAEIALQLVGYVTARIVVPLFSLGLIRVEPAPHGVKVSPRWHGFQRGSNGLIVVTAEMGSLLGIFFWIAIAMLFYFGNYYFNS